MLSRISTRQTHTTTDSSKFGKRESYVSRYCTGEASQSQSTSDHSGLDYTSLVATMSHTIENTAEELRRLEEEEEEEEEETPEAEAKLETKGKLTMEERKAKMEQLRKKMVCIYLRAHEFTSLISPS